MAAFGVVDAPPPPEFPMIMPITRHNAATTTSCQVFQERRSFIFNSPGAGPPEGAPGVDHAPTSPTTVSLLTQPDLVRPLAKR